MSANEPRELGFAERFENGPLIVPIVYKSVLFSSLLVTAYVLEEIVIGQFHGKGVAESFPSLVVGHGWHRVCHRALVYRARSVFCVQANRAYRR